MTCNDYMRLESLDAMEIVAESIIFPEFQCESAVRKTKRNMAPSTHVGGIDASAEREDGLLRGVERDAARVVEVAFVPPEDSVTGGSLARRGVFVAFLAGLELDFILRRDFLGWWRRRCR